MQHMLTDEKRIAGLEIVGIGSAGPIALHAAALDDRFKEVTIERSVVSWSAVVQSPISVNQLTNVVPGALIVYDLPDLAATLAPRKLTIRAAVDGAGKPVPRSVLEEAYAACRKAYEGTKDALLLQAGP
jgi:hypothetical protein